MGDHLRVSVIGAMEIDGEERNGVFLEGSASAIKCSAILFDEEVRIVPAATPPEVMALVEALRWYAGNVCNCNRHGRDGDTARDRLANDIGNRAREALAKWEAAQK